MPGVVHFLRCVGRAAVNNAGRAFAGLFPLGETAYDIARDACRQYRQEEPATVTLAGPHRVYALLDRLAAGDVADVHLAGEGNQRETPYLVKIARSPAGNALLENERQVLARLASAAKDATYRGYLPAVVESFSTVDAPARRVNVFRHEPGFFTLEQVHERHPNLDGRHLGWAFKRLLTVLGFCHRHGTLHGAVLPCHVLLHPAGHGLRLVGWGQSVAAGRPITTTSPGFGDWYPPEVRKRLPATTATDLYLAARCVLHLAGGSAPPPMRRFFETCLLEGMRMRPQDAWRLQDEFDELLGRLYGPPKFHPLSMS